MSHAASAHDDDRDEQRRATYPRDGLHPLGGRAGDLVGGAHRAVEVRGVAGVERGDDAAGQAAPEVGRVHAASGEPVE